MEKVKDILFIILGSIITLVFLWFFFTIALPILLIIGVVVLIYFWLKKKNIFKTGKKILKKNKEKVKEAVIIEEK